jgi:aminoglycoside phosphotransferase (APT) family kinase protein
MTHAADPGPSPAQAAGGTALAGLALDTLEPWLRRALPDADGPLRIDAIGGGQSNPTFFVDFGGPRYVLRKQPAGPVLPSAHAVDREFRILSALAGTAVPVPRPVVYCDDRSVTGTPFYVMERIDGRVLHDNALPEATPGERTPLYRAAAETLAALHRVDWQAAGLGDFGRPGSFYPRQLARWTKQHALSQGRPIPAIDTLVARLPGLMPEDDATAIVHGDYRMGNLMMHPTEPRVVAVLDWELSTLGHPLADLAHMLMAWHSRPAEYGGLVGLDLPALGLPDEAAVVAAYDAAAAHGLRLGPFHIAFALFRFAVVFEGIAARAQAGNAAASNAADLAPLAEAFAARGLEVLDGRRHA